MATRCLSMWVLGLTFLLSAWISCAGAADVYLSISRGGGQRLRLAIPDFVRAEGGGTSEGGLGHEMAQTLAEDLRVYRFFDVIENQKFLQEAAQADAQAGNIAFKEWAEQGAQALVKGTYTQDGRDLIIECRLFDVPGQSMITGKRYRGPSDAVASIMHRCADEIMIRFTGEPGIAQTKVAFISRQRGNKELFVMDHNGANIRQLTQEQSIVLSPAWSPDGGALAITSYRDRNPDLFVISLNGNGRRPLSQQPGLNSAPAWSPDGTRLAVVLTKDGNSEIYLMNRNGTDIRRLTNHPAIDTSPTWSPTGRQIAFVSNRSGSPQIFIMEAEGSNVRRLTYQGNYNAGPSWSPRGDRIAFVSQEGSRFDVYVINVDGSGLQRLTLGHGSNESPSWSPDGRFLVFSSTRTGTPQLFRMYDDGSGLQQLTFLEGGALSPVWSPRIVE
ncbi:MAG: Tol-Pal system beta propeller repeat protein TolB [Nitrospinae bacterium]|nr:Tol-Pal system beta propeller repeat protein TolB [Nitrospinota bacterium]